MSANEKSEQDREGFEAWARKEGYENLGGEYGGPGNVGWWYWSDETAAAWDGWCAAMQQREASTEPSAGLAAELRSAARLIRQDLKLRQGMAEWTDSEQSKACDDAAAIIERLGAGALPDEAKDAARLLSACRKAVTALAHAASNPLYASAYEELSAAIEAHTKAGKQT